MRFSTQFPMSPAPKTTIRSALGSLTVEVKLFLVKDNYELGKFLKNNIYGKKIVVGMGAGTISNWMRRLPEIMK